MGGSLSVRQGQRDSEGALMKQKVAWYFESALLLRDDLKRKLDSISATPWQEWDSDSGQDSISKKITDHTGCGSTSSVAADMLPT